MAGPKGDEPIAALSRLEVKNSTNSARTINVWFKIPQGISINIDDDGLLILDRPTKPAAGKNFTPIWGQIQTKGRGELAYLRDYLVDGAKPQGPRNLVQYTVNLSPGDSHSIIVKVTYLEQLSSSEILQLKLLDWDKSCKKVKHLWNKRLARAIENYQVPNTELMNLYRANLWHVLIGTDRDPSTGLYQHGAGTYAYPMYANETMMVARSLEMRGEHEEARRLYEPYLMSQGQRGLPGNFKTKEGVLYAAAPKEFDQYTAQGYNMHHGFILWAAAEHFLWTADMEYLKAIAPNLIAACGWVTRERKATKTLNPDGSRPIEYGLAPAGDLEDVEEYLYWYATNAYYYLGMKTTAHALEKINHPQTARISADAAAYKEDILTSINESIATSPVVKLLDGYYIPYIPPRAYALTDRKEGWIRESLYCSLHLVDCGLLNHNDMLTTWILNELEDRIFMSEESGYGPKHGHTNPREQFFSYGGFNPQPNLLDNSIAYLKRDQVKHFLRAFWNTYTISIYPDIQCFAELCSYGMGGGPLYKTPDECKFIQWMHQMLVFEMDDNLYIGRGVPRSWMADGKKVILKNAATYFGPIDIKIISSIAEGQIKAELNLPTRSAARGASLSLRHPDNKKIKSVKINGQDWNGFDAATDMIILPKITGKVNIVALF